MDIFYPMCVLDSQAGQEGHAMITEILEDFYVERCTCSCCRIVSRDRKKNFSHQDQPLFLDSIPISILTEFNI